MTDFDHLVNMLERAHPDALYALKFGTLALAQSVLRDMTERDADVTNVTRLQRYVDILAQLPWAKEN